MSDQPIAGCDGCKTTAGRMGCPAHRDTTFGVGVSFTPEPMNPEIVSLRSELETAHKLLSHLESWRDRVGNVHDLTNPEYQVQTILDRLAEAKASAVAWTHIATERGLALAEARAALHDMVSVAALDDWADATTGRQLVLAAANRVLGAALSGQAEGGKE